MVLIVNENIKESMRYRRNIQKSMLKNQIEGHIDTVTSLEEAKVKIKDGEKEAITHLLILKTKDLEKTKGFIEWARYACENMRIYLLSHPMYDWLLQEKDQALVFSEESELLIAYLFDPKVKGDIGSFIQREAARKEKTLPVEGRGRCQFFMVAGRGFDAYDLAHQLSGGNTKGWFNKRKEKRRILCMDLNLLNPSLDQILGIDYRLKGFNSHMMVEDATGINLMIDAYRKEVLSRHLLNQLIHQEKSIDYLLGNYNISNYEYYKWEEIEALLRWLSDYYDGIVIHTSQSVYDEITIHCMHLADRIFYSSGPFLYDVRNKIKLLTYTCNKQKIPVEKCRLIVASLTMTTLDWSLIEELESPLPILAINKSPLKKYDNYKLFYNKNRRRICRQWQL